MDYDFCTALVAEGGSIPPEDDFYGQFVGAWDFEWTDSLGGKERRIPGEWYFSWIIQGQALQDVFICPARQARKAGVPEDAEFGTTLRVYEPEKGAWSLIYTTRGHVVRFRARRERSGDIVQDCVDDNPFLMRWIFSEITPDSFRWSNYTSLTGGAAWDLNGELRARRRKG